MARKDLITVAQLRQTMRDALAKLEAYPDDKPINLAFYNEESGNQDQAGFVTSLGFTFEPSMDEEQTDLNMDVTYKEA